MLSSAEMKDLTDGKLVVPLHRSKVEVVPLVTYLVMLDVALTASVAMVLHIF